MSDMIIALFSVLIIIMLLWILDDVLLYSILTLISTDISIDILNSGNNFFTIPASMRITFSIIWIFVSLIGWSKVYRLAKRARERYNKKLESEQ